MADGIEGLIPLVVTLAVVKTIFDDDDHHKSRKIFSEKKHTKKKGILEW